MLARRLAPLWPLAAYTLLALLALWPLPLSFTSSIPGIEGDAWSYLWALGWIRTALLDTGTNLLHSDYIFYPLGGATQLFWSLSLVGFLSLPLQLAFGLVPAYNLLYLAATVVTGYSTYLLVLDLTRSSLPSSTRAPQLAAFVAGAAFAFSPLRQGYGLAFLNLFNTWLIPLYLLFWLRVLRRMRASYAHPASHGAPPLWSVAVRDALVAGLLLGLHAYLDFQLASFLALFTCLALLLQVAQFGRRRPPARAVLMPILLLGIATLLTSLPMLVAVQNEFAVEGGDYIRVFPLRYSALRSYDLLSYIVPNARSALYSRLPSPRIAGVNAALDVEGESQLSPDRQAFVGYTFLLLSLVGFCLAPREGLLWAISALFFAVISLGPTLHIAGRDTALQLPFILLHELPVVNHIRVPMRYGLFVPLSLAVLAGLGLDRLLRLGQPARLALPLTGLLLFLLLFESALVPYPLLAFSPPSFYARLAREPGDFTILEVPTFNWRFASLLEAYQAIHHKRILRAYSNRIAPSVADYFSLRQTPVVVRSLRLLEGAEPGLLTAPDLQEDRATAAQVIAFFHLRYAVLHNDLLDPERTAALARYLQDVLGAARVDSDGPAVLYALPSTSGPPPPEFDADSNLALLYLGRGWQTEPLANLEGDSGRWLRGSAAEFYFPGEAASTLLLRAGCRQPTPAQVDLNGTSLGRIDLPIAWGSVTLSFPQNALRAMNRLTLRFDVPQRENCAISQLGWK